MQWMAAPPYDRRHEPRTMQALVCNFVPSPALFKRLEKWRLQQENDSITFWSLLCSIKRDVVTNQVLGVGVGAGIGEGKGIVFKEGEDRMDLVLAWRSSKLVKRDQQFQ